MGTVVIVNNKSTAIYARVGSGDGGSVRIPPKGQVVLTVSDSDTCSIVGSEGTTNTFDVTPGGTYTIS
jgi:hypothetical protein